MYNKKEVVHQVGKKDNHYLRMHRQQNIKKASRLWNYRNVTAAASVMQNYRNITETASGM